MLANGFGAYTEYVTSNYPYGTFLGISPSGSAVRGTSIRILVSSGPPRQPSQPDKPTDKPTKKPSEKPKPSPTPSKKPR